MSTEREPSPFERALTDVLLSAMPQYASRLTQVTREGNCTQIMVLGVRDEEQVLDAVADALAAIRAEYPDDPFDVDVKLRRE